MFEQMPARAGDFLDAGMTYRGDGAPTVERRIAPVPRAWDVAPEAQLVAWLTEAASVAPMRDPSQPPAAGTARLLAA